MTAPSDRQRLADQLVGWALEVGFARAGVASLEPSAHGEVYRRWLERGDQAGMTWLTRQVEERLEPARLLPGARSALCVALTYHPLADEPEPDGDLWPSVARYARGRDYHDLVRERLRALAARVEAAFTGTQTRVCVDTSPLLERELATRAGLGAIGKHTLLLHPEGGSWFLLGELLLSLDLAPSTPLADLCGSCTRCLDACPTGALPEPYRLDANRCISYWTIEHRGVVPAELRSQVGAWAFGCDACQEACPWNAAPPAADEPELRLPPARRELDLAGLLRLGRERYVELMRGSALKRAKLAGLRRNAALAMGHQATPRYAPELAAALADPEPELRRHVAWALGRVGGPASRAALAAALPNETDPEVRAELAAALAASATGSTAIDSPGGAA